MRLLVIGAAGFIGREVVAVSQKTDIEAWRADKSIENSLDSKAVDLFDKDSIKEVLKEICPDYIINCAGTVENTEKAYAVNPVFTLNLLQAILELKQTFKKIIIIGSAGEYGIVGKDKLPVKEETPLLASNNYPRSKILESSIALAFRASYSLPVVVARVFNPIGVGMHSRFLIPSLIRQIEEIKGGGKKELEIERLDSYRDYISVTDIGEALLAICQKNAVGPVYNIGSGNKTENKILLDMLLREMGVTKKPKIRETRDTSELVYAVQADITKIKKDTDWSPRTKLSETIKGIVNDYKKQ